MVCSLPGFSVYGIVQARILYWVAIPFSRGSFWPRGWTQVSCIGGKFFTIWATREAHIYGVNTKIKVADATREERKWDWRKTHMRVSIVLLMLHFLKIIWSKYGKIFSFGNMHGRTWWILFNIYYFKRERRVWWKGDWGWRYLLRMFLA